uniref:Tom40 n=1 Tax=Amoeba proteus TaxID=5775 RepID=A0A0H3YC93_AMOPR|nr:Tom40 [Amoeba proteus]
MALFNKDFGKAVRDVLTEDFPSVFEVEVNSKPGADLVVKTTAEFRDDNTVQSNIKPSFDTKYGKVELDFSSSGKITGTFTNRDSLAKNLKTSLSTNYEASKQSVSVSGDYTFKQGTFSGKVNFPGYTLSAGAPSVVTGLVYNVQSNLNVGTELYLRTASETGNYLEKVVGNLQLAKPDWIFSGNLIYANGNVDLIGRVLKRAGNVSYALEAGFKQKNSASYVNVGLESRLANQTTGKAVFKSEPFAVALSYKKRLDEITVTAATEVNLRTNNHKTGFSVDLNL